ncbi:hypothetical protein C8R47DRAFT_153361 [Mycena vitilis]|nr:hypothetical protein C8R47DRAFT_153361 [Mycena vitilis]
MLLLLHKPKPPISHRAYDEETLVDVELGLDSKSAKKRSIKSSIGAIFGSKRREGAPTYPSHEPKSLPCAEPFNYPKRSTRARSAQAVKRLRARMLKSRRTPAALQRSDSQMTLLDADSALAHKPKASRAGVEGGHSPKLLFKFLALKIPISLRLNPVKRALERLVAQLGRSALGVLIPILKGVGGIVRFFLDLGWGVVKLCFWVAKAVLIG